MSIYTDNEKHEKPYEDPEIGTPNQKTIDTSIRTLRYMKEMIKGLKETLELNKISLLPSKLRRIFNFVERLSSKITIKELNETEVIEAIGKCEKEQINSNFNIEELSEIRAELEEIDYYEIQRKLNEAQDYIIEMIKEKVGKAGGLGSGESSPVVKKLEYWKEKIKKVAEPPKDLDDVVEWCGNVCELIFQGPLGKIIKLIVFYGEWGTNLSEEGSELLKEVQTFLLELTRISIDLSGLLPQFQQIPTVVNNINKIQKIVVQTKADTITQYENINREIFSLRSSGDSTEENQYIEEMKNEERKDVLKKLS